MSDAELVSARLILRRWRDADVAAFAAMCADAETTRYLLPIPSVAAAAAWIDSQRAHFAAHGFGAWAVDRADTGAFIGAVGLLRVGYTAHFTPATEIAWRLGRPHWGRGYAPEAAGMALRFGFERLSLAEIVANTVPENHNSQRVMQKLGMTRSAADDFDHPRIAPGHPLRRQVLYRLTRDRWRARLG
jgi:RimJ/RimL family protein N-acetyltransferase